MSVQSNTHDLLKSTYATAKLYKRLSASTRIVQDNKPRP